MANVRLPWILLVVFMLHNFIEISLQAKRPTILRKLKMKVICASGCTRTHPLYRIDNLTVHQDHKSLFTVTGNFSLYKHVAYVTQLVATIRRCTDFTEESCEIFQTWRFNNNVCGMAEMKNMLWTPLVIGINPPLRCPLRKGPYEVVNATLDVSKIETLFGAVLENNYWRSRVEVFDKDGVFACILYDLSFLRGKQ